MKLKLLNIYNIILVIYLSLFFNNIKSKHISVSSYNPITIIANYNESNNSFKDNINNKILSLIIQIRFNFTKQPNSNSNILIKGQYIGVILPINLNKIFKSHINNNNFNTDIKELIRCKLYYKTLENSNYYFDVVSTINHEEKNIIYCKFNSYNYDLTNKICLNNENNYNKCYYTLELELINNSNNNNNNTTLYFNGSELYNSYINGFKLIHTTSTSNNKIILGYSDYISSFSLIDYEQTKTNIIEIIDVVSTKSICNTYTNYNIITKKVLNKKDDNCFYLNLSDKINLSLIFKVNNDISNKSNNTQQKQYIDYTDDYIDISKYNVMLSIDIDNIDYNYISKFNNINLITSNEFYAYDSNLIKDNVIKVNKLNIDKNYPYENIKDNDYLNNSSNSFINRMHFKVNLLPDTVNNNIDISNNINNNSDSAESFYTYANNISKKSILIKKGSYYNITLNNVYLNNVSKNNFKSSFIKITLVKKNNTIVDCITSYKAFDVNKVIVSSPLIIDVNSINTNKSKNIRMLSVHHPEYFDMHQGGSYPLQFNLAILNDIKSSFLLSNEINNNYIVIKIQQYNKNVSSSIFNFIASTCEFNLKSYNSNNSINNMYNSLESKKPICYPLNSFISSNASFKEALSNNYNNNNNNNFVPNSSGIVILIRYDSLNYILNEEDKFIYTQNSNLINKKHTYKNKSFINKEQNLSFTVWGHALKCGETNEINSNTIELFKIDEIDKNNIINKLDEDNNINNNGTNTNDINITNRLNSKLNNLLFVKFEFEVEIYYRKVYYDNVLNKNFDKYYLMNEKHIITTYNKCFSSKISSLKDNLNDVNYETNSSQINKTLTKVLNYYDLLRSEINLDNNNNNNNYKDYLIFNEIYNFNLLKVDYNKYNKCLANNNCWLNDLNKYIPELNTKDNNLLALYNTIYQDNNIYNSVNNKYISDIKKDTYYNNLYWFNLTFELNNKYLIDYEIKNNYNYNINSNNDSFKPIDFIYANTLTFNKDINQFVSNSDIGYNMEMTFSSNYFIKNNISFTKDNTLNYNDDYDNIISADNCYISWGSSSSSSSSSRSNFNGNIDSNTVYNQNKLIFSKNEIISYKYQNMNTIDNLIILNQDNITNNKDYINIYANNNIIYNNKLENFIFLYDNKEHINDSILSNSMLYNSNNYLNNSNKHLKLISDIVNKDNNNNNNNNNRFILFSDSALSNTNISAYQGNLFSNCVNIYVPDSNIFTSLYSYNEINVKINIMPNIPTDITSDLKNTYKAYYPGRTIRFIKLYPEVGFFKQTDINNSNTISNVDKSFIEYHVAINDNLYNSRKLICIVELKPNLLNKYMHNFNTLALFVNNLELLDVDLDIIDNTTSNNNNYSLLSYPIVNVNNNVNVLVYRSEPLNSFQMYNLMDYRNSIQNSFTSIELNSSDNILERYSNAMYTKLENEYYLFNNKDITTESELKSKYNMYLGNVIIINNIDNNITINKDINSMYIPVYCPTIDISHSNINENVLSDNLYYNMSSHPYITANLLNNQIITNNNNNNNNNIKILENNAYYFTNNNIKIFNNYSNTNSYNSYIFSFKKLLFNKKTIINNNSYNTNKIDSNENKYTSISFNKFISSTGNLRWNINDNNSDINNLLIYNGNLFNKSSSIKSTSMVLVLNSEDYALFSSDILSIKLKVNNVSSNNNSNKNESIDFNDSDNKDDNRLFQTVNNISYPLTFKNFKVNNLKYDNLLVLTFNKSIVFDNELNNEDNNNTYVENIIPNSTSSTSSTSLENSVNEIEFKAQSIDLNDSNSYNNIKQTELKFYNNNLYNYYIPNDSHYIFEGLTKIFKNKYNYNNINKNYYEDNILNKSNVELNNELNQNKQFLNSFNYNVELIKSFNEGIINSDILFFCLSSLNSNNSVFTNLISIDKDINNKLLIDYNNNLSVFKNIYSFTQGNYLVDYNHNYNYIWDKLDFSHEESTDISRDNSSYAIKAKFESYYKGLNNFSIVFKSKNFISSTKCGFNIVDYNNDYLVECLTNSLISRNNSEEFRESSYIVICSFSANGISINNNLTLNTMDIYNNPNFNYFNTISSNILNKQTLFVSCFNVNTASDPFTLSLFNIVNTSNNNYSNLTSNSYLINTVLSIGLLDSSSNPKYYYNLKQTNKELINIATNDSVLSFIEYVFYPHTQYENSLGVGILSIKLAKEITINNTIEIEADFYKFIPTSLFDLLNKSKYTINPYCKVKFNHEIVDESNYHKFEFKFKNLKSKTIDFNISTNKLKNIIHNYSSDYQYIDNILEECIIDDIYKYSNNTNRDVNRRSKIIIKTKNTIFKSGLSNIAKSNKYLILAISPMKIIDFKSIDTSSSSIINDLSNPLPYNINNSNLYNNNNNDESKIKDDNINNLYIESNSNYFNFNISTYTTSNNIKLLNNAIYLKTIKNNSLVYKTDFYKYENNLFNNSNNFKKDSNHNSYLENFDNLCLIKSIFPKIEGSYSTHIIQFNLDIIFKHALFYDFINNYNKYSYVNELSLFFPKNIYNLSKEKLVIKLEDEFYYGNIDEKLDFNILNIYVAKGIEINDYLSNPLILYIYGIMNPFKITLNNVQPQYILCSINQYDSINQLRQNLVYGGNFNQNFNNIYDFKSLETYNYLPYYRGKIIIHSIDNLIDNNNKYLKDIFESNLNDIDIINNFKNHIKLYNNNSITKNIYNSKYSRNKSSLKIIFALKSSEIFTFNNNDLNENNNIQFVNYYKNPFFSIILPPQYLLNNKTVSDFKCLVLLFNKDHLYNKLDVNNNYNNFKVINIDRIMLEGSKVDIFLNSPLKLLIDKTNNISSNIFIIYLMNLINPESTYNLESDSLINYQLSISNIDNSLFYTSIINTKPLNFVLNTSSVYDNIQNIKDNYNSDFIINNNIDYYDLINGSKGIQYNYNTNKFIIDVIKQKEKVLVNSYNINNGNFTGDKIYENENDINTEVDYVNDFEIPINTIKVIAGRYNRYIFRIRNTNNNIITKNKLYSFTKIELKESYIVKTNKSSYFLFSNENQTKFYIGTSCKSPLSKLIVYFNSSNKELYEDILPIKTEIVFERNIINLYSDNTYNRNIANNYVFKNNVDKEDYNKYPQSLDYLYKEKDTYIYFKFDEVNFDEIIINPTFEYNTNLGVEAKNIVVYFDKLVIPKAYQINDYFESEDIIYYGYKQPLFSKLYYDDKARSYFNANDFVSSFKFILNSNLSLSNNNIYDNNLSNINNNCFEFNPIFNNVYEISTKTTLINSSYYVFENTYIIDKSILNNNVLNTILNNINVFEEYDANNNNSNNNNSQSILLNITIKEIKDILQEFLSIDSSKVEHYNSIKIIKLKYIINKYKVINNEFETSVNNDNIVYNEPIIIKNTDFFRYFTVINYYNNIENFYNTHYKLNGNIKSTESYNLNSNNYKYLINIDNEYKYKNMTSIAIQHKPFNLNYDLYCSLICENIMYFEEDILVKYIDQYQTNNLQINDYKALDIIYKNTNFNRTNTFSNFNNINAVKSDKNIENLNNEFSLYNKDKIDFYNSLSINNISIDKNSNKNNEYLNYILKLSKGAKHIKRSFFNNHYNETYYDVKQSIVSDPYIITFDNLKRGQNYKLQCIAKSHTNSPNSKNFASFKSSFIFDYNFNNNLKTPKYNSNSVSKLITSYTINDYCFQFSFDRNRLNESMSKYNIPIKMLKIFFMDIIQSSFYKLQYVKNGCVNIYENNNINIYNNDFKIKEKMNINNNNQLLNEYSNLYDIKDTLYYQKNNTLNCFENEFEFIPIKNNTFYIEYNFNKKYNNKFDNNSVINLNNTLKYLNFSILDNSTIIDYNNDSNNNNTESKIKDLDIKLQNKTININLYNNTDIDNIIKQLNNTSNSLNQTINKQFYYIFDNEESNDNNSNIFYNDTSDNSRIVVSYEYDYFTLCTKQDNSCDNNPYFKSNNTLFNAKYIIKQLEILFSNSNNLSNLLNSIFHTKDNFKILLETSDMFILNNTIINKNIDLDKLKDSSNFYYNNNYKFNISKLNNYLIDLNNFIINFDIPVINNKNIYNSSFIKSSLDSLTNVKVYANDYNFKEVNAIKNIINEYKSTIFDSQNKEQSININNYNFKIYDNYKDEIKLSNIGINIETGSISFTAQSNVNYQCFFYFYNTNVNRLSLNPFTCEYEKDVVCGKMFIEKNKRSYLFSNKYISNEDLYNKFEEKTYFENLEQYYESKVIKEKVLKFSYGTYLLDISCLLLSNKLINEINFFSDKVDVTNNKYNTYEKYNRENINKNSSFINKEISNNILTYFNEEELNYINLFIDYKNYIKDNLSFNTDNAKLNLFKSIYPSDLLILSYFHNNYYNYNIINNDISNVFTIDVNRIFEYSSRIAKVYNNLELKQKILLNKINYIKQNYYISNKINNNDGLIYLLNSINGEYFNEYTKVNERIPYSDLHFINYGKYTFNNKSNSSASNSSLNNQNDLCNSTSKNYIEFLTEDGKKSYRCSTINISINIISIFIILMFIVF